MAEQALKKKHTRRFWGGVRHGWVDLPAIGRSGGLLTLWDLDLVEVIDVLHGAYSLSITARWKQGTKNKWTLSNIYAPVESCFKAQFWEELDNVAGWAEDEWLLAGDFNSTLLHQDRCSSLLSKDSAAFQAFMNKHSMLDYSLCGDKYTHRHCATNNLSRLDRFIASTAWLSSFGNSYEQALHFYKSDHRIIKLQPSFIPTFGPKPFRFQNQWFEIKSLLSSIKLWWNQACFNGSPGYIFHSKLRVIKSSLKTWCLENCDMFEVAIQQAESSIKALEEMEEQNPLTLAQIEDYKAATRKLHEAVNREGAYWKQKGQLVWAKEGDRNSRMMHNFANRASLDHNIKSLLINGSPVEDLTSITTHINEFYTNLYTEPKKQRPLLLGAQLPSITQDQATRLEGRFLEKEILVAIKQLGQDKTPGPDGFTMRFYHKCWSIIKVDLVNVFQELYEKNYINWRINTSFISLIPKEDNARSIQDYRPINLIHGVGKILSKVLANRLSKVMKTIISPFQGAGVAGRVIHHQVLVANEVIDSVLRSKQKGTIIKLDFKKAFDTISWSFMTHTLRTMGFGERWIAWIVAGWTSSHFSIIINGKVHGFHRPTRGIRQGDPLSTMLFVIGVEVLTSIFLQAQASNIISGLRAAPDAPKVPILQYADDTLVMCESSNSLMSSILALLLWFETISGLAINCSKSMRITLNGEGTLSSFDTIYQERSLPINYLGLPLGAKFKNKEMWSRLKEFFQKRLANWKKKFLSKGARVILIKATLQALPIHLMTLFVIPTSISSQLERRMREFLWDKGGDQRVVPLVAWKNVTKPFSKGGLGVRPLLVTMKSLQTKWIWELQQNTHALWKEVIRSKYKINRLFWQSKDPKGTQGCSPWKGIWKSAAWLKSCTTMKIGCGNSTTFWKDRWCGDQPLAIRFPQIFALANKPLGSVEDHLITSQGRTDWNLWIRRGIRDQEMEQIQELISSLPTPVRSPLHDRITWQDSTKPLSVKQASIRLNQVQGSTMPVKNIWNKHVPTKVGFFVWTLYQLKIPTQDRLKGRGLQIASRCVLCKQQEETLQHLMWDCSVSQRIIVNLHSQLHQQLTNCHTPNDLVKDREANNLSQIGRLVWNIIPHAYFWAIWLERNERLFEENERSTAAIEEGIVGMMWSWLRLNPLMEGVSSAFFRRNWQTLCRPL